MFLNGESEGMTGTMCPLKFYIGIRLEVIYVSTHDNYICNQTRNPYFAFMKQFHTTCCNEKPNVYTLSL
jgi:hypothetical protein